MAVQYGRRIRRHRVVELACGTVAATLFIILTNLSMVTEARAAQIASEAETRAAIERTLRGPDRLSLPVERVREILTIHYLDRNGRLFWIGTPLMQQLVDRVARAHADGLKQKDYAGNYLSELRDAADLSSPEHAAFAELMFSAFFLVYASDMKVGRFVPSKIDPELFLERRSVDGPALLKRLSDYKDLQRFFAEWEPQHPAYKALRSVLVRYREIEGAGGWPKIDPGEVLKPGMQDPRVLQIRKRLHASYDMRATTTATDVYDDNLTQAMRGFQKRHGLDPDGVIGKNTLIALNVSTSDRVRQIIANMERWRWMPEKMGADHIMVNIAGFELIRVRGGKVVRHMPVVVGKTYHRTPVFSDRIRYLEFNPTWTVPYSIATKEFLPKLKQDPEAYATRDFDLLQSGTSVSWYGIDWQQFSTRKFPYTIRQNPGPKNALGRVKFMFPNKHNVYLHDTPARSLFAKSYRALSHGCVRLAEPVKFAEEVLADLPGWSPERINNVLTSAETTKVSLKKPIPVHLVYATVWLAADGTVHFRPDIYGRDERLFRALFAKHTP